MQHNSHTFAKIFNLRRERACPPDNTCKDMKKHLTILLASLAVSLAGNARQVMTLLTGEEIEVEIVTLGTSEISYKKASNPDGPTYTTARDKVFFILYEDGSKEVITPAGGAAADTSISTPDGGAASITEAMSAPLPPEKDYFPHITFYPRASVGFHATPSGYEDQFDIDWGGLSWSVDLNVLFPTGNTSAWSVGVGLAGLGGEMNMSYIQGGKNHKDKMGDFDVMYFTIPLQYWYKCGDWFTFGFGNRFEFLVSQKMGGNKVEDAFRAFRDALTIDGICSVGNFDIGAQFLFNFSSAIKGDGFDWSPTLGLSFTAGYRF